MASVELQPHSANSPPATTFDPEAVAHPAPTAAAFQALEQARAADRLWREERRAQLEKQLVRGQWLQQRVVNPLLTALGICMNIPLVGLAHSPAGIGVDLSSDWSLVQWCARYVVCLAIMLLPQVSIHRWVSRKFARWEARLRLELGQPDDA